MGIVNPAPARVGRSALFRHLLGSTRAMTGRLLVLVFIAGSALGILAGAFSAIDSTLAGRNEWNEEGQAADIELAFQTQPNEALPDFATVPGVHTTRSRALISGTLDLPQRPPLTSYLITGQADDQLNLNSLVLLEGSLLAADDVDGALIDWHLAEAHGVGLGAELEFTVSDQIIRFTVRGIVRDSQYLLTPANPNLFIPSKGSLGIVFANPTQLEALWGFTPVNSILIRSVTGQDLETLRTQIMARAESASLAQAHTMTPDEQFTALYLDRNLAVFTEVIPVIAGVTGLSAVFVTFFLLARWLAQERRNIAVTLTLGYQRTQIAAALAAILVLGAIASILVGVAIAYGLDVLFIRRFAAAVGLPIARAVLTVRYVLLGCVGLLTIFTAAGVFMVRSVARMTPLDAMRDLSSGERPVGVLASWLGARAPTSWLRLAARNTMQTKLVSLLTIVALSLGFGTTSAFFACMTSVRATAVRNVEINDWDFLIDLETPLTRSEIEQLGAQAGVDELSLAAKGTARITHSGASANLFLSGLETTRLWYEVIELSAGTDIRADQPNGIAVEQSTATELGLEIGAEYRIATATGSHTVVLLGVFSGALPGETRCTLEFATEVLGLGELFTGAFIRIGAADFEEVRSRLLDQPEVTQALTRDEIKTEILAFSDQLNQIIYIGTGIAISIALLFVHACLGYTILMRKGDYQLLRTLGYQDQTIRATILAETLFLGLLGAGLAVPVGMGVTNLLNGQIGTAWFHIASVFRPIDFVKGISPGLGLLPIVALLMAQGVLRTPLDAYLRSREIG